MSKSEKIQKTITIALGFALATYLIMSGMAILNSEKKADENKTGRIENLKKE
ncbi:MULTISPECIES: hypothetical protein [Sulfurimonas]|uniref:hypothetical protein n=1 Tax=Sulfurimonas TaxID=202746 RepID=UPI0016600714|nr:hypothetical protein [Sulfurimonas indica]